MVRLIVSALAISFLSGCSFFPVKLRTETVEVVRPVLYCPAPNYEELARPQTLPIDAITDETSDGEVAVRYKATVKTLQQYINRLELSLEQYDDTSGALEELRKQLNLEKPAE
jgi:hypothetical protein